VSQDSVDPNFARALEFVRRRGAWIVLCFVLAVAAAVGISKHQTKKYTSTASVALSSNSLSQEIAGLATSSTDALQQQANSLELLHLGDMAAKTATILGHGLSERRVVESLTITAAPESNIATVAATTTSPTLAALIANTYVQKFVTEQDAKTRAYFRSALAHVRKQLAALSPAQRIGTDGLNLQERAQSLALLAELQPNTVQIAQKAAVPTSPSSPRTSRNALIGGMLGILLGLSFAFLLERLDPRIRGSRDLEEAYRLPLLGVVPQSSALARAGQPGDGTPLDIPLAESEAFHLIRARLRSYNPSREIRTLLVVSASADEGKTTVACHLAAAAARMGSRVLLLDADLRNPNFAQLLGVDTQIGLSDVLVGATDLRSATKSIGLLANLANKTKAGSLDVLSSGSSVPTNPVELIESNALRVLLAQAKSVYDLVVIEAPELTIVSDAFLLLPKVDGVVVVGRMGRSRRDVANRLRQVLDASGAPLVGVIANGVKRTQRGPEAPAAHLSRQREDLTASGISPTSVSAGG
jgi:capsular exopolysaccharide synthesis family protein